MTEITLAEPETESGEPQDGGEVRKKRGRHPKDCPCDKCVARRSSPPPGRGNEAPADEAPKFNPKDPALVAAGQQVVKMAANAAFDTLNASLGVDGPSAEEKDMWIASLDALANYYELAGYVGHPLFGFVLCTGVIAKTYAKQVAEKDEQKPEVPLSV